ncbi:MAG: hypothetical protein ABEJ31_04040 [Haloarculaceae archaeon]
MSESEMELPVELGQATIVYEDPEEGTTSQTVKNEQVLYVRDHWVVQTGKDDQGNDLMLQIPRDRVHHVQRNVEHFEEEAKTVRHRVESIADDIRRMLPMDVGDGRSRRQGHAAQRGSTSESTTVEINEGQGSSSGAGSSGSSTEQSSSAE